MLQKLAKSMIQVLLQFRYPTFTRIPRVYNDTTEGEAEVTSNNDEDESNSDDLDDQQLLLVVENWDLLKQIIIQLLLQL